MTPTPITLVQRLRDALDECNDPQDDENYSDQIADADAWLAAQRGAGVAEDAPEALKRAVRDWGQAFAIDLLDPRSKPFLHDQQYVVAWTDGTRQELVEKLKEAGLVAPPPASDTRNAEGDTSAFTHPDSPLGRCVTVFQGWSWWRDLDGYERRKLFDQVATALVEPAPGADAAAGSAEPWKNVGMMPAAEPDERRLAMHDSDTAVRILADRIVYKDWREWSGAIWGFDRLKLRNWMADRFTELLASREQAARAEGAAAAFEEAARLHESVHPHCDHEPGPGCGAGAMRAVIQYRDLIRARGQS